MFLVSLGWRGRTYTLPISFRYFYSNLTISRDRPKWVSPQPQGPGDLSLLLQQQRRREDGAKGQWKPLRYLPEKMRAVSDGWGAHAAGCWGDLWSVRVGQDTTAWWRRTWEVGARSYWGPEPRVHSHSCSLSTVFNDSFLDFTKSHVFWMWMSNSEWWEKVLRSAGSTRRETTHLECTCFLGF